MQQKTTLLIWIFLFLTSLTFGGCYMGPKATSVLSANGAMGQISLQRNVDTGPTGYDSTEKIEVEILSLMDEGLLVKANRGILQIRYGALRYAKIKHGGTFRFNRDVTDEEVKNKLEEKYSGRLKLLSRFPQGVSSELLENLLASNAQDTLIIIS